MQYTHAKVWGNTVLYRFVNARGERKNEKVEFKPSLFIPSNKPSPWKTIDDKPVSEVKFETIKEAKDFIAQYQHVDNFDMYGNSGWVYQFLSEKYPGDIRFDINKINVSYLDIEVNSSNGFPHPEAANEPITAITITYGNTVHTYGCKPYVSKEDNHAYHKCKDEYDLLSQFLRRFQLEQPDVISGWNIQTFDVPYIVNRMTKILGPNQTKLLSPWGIVREKKQRIKIGSNYVDKIGFEIGGISTIDYLTAYQKFTYDPRESYTLHFIAETELEDTKIEYDSELGLHGLYDTDYEKFIDYNIKDVLLVQKLDEKLNLMSLIFFLAYQAKVNFEDAFSQVRMWDALIYNDLKAKHIVVPFKEVSGKDEKYEGAFVKVPVPGLYRRVASFDAASLYPSLIIQYNIGSDTLVPWHMLPLEVREYFQGKQIDVDAVLDKKYDTALLKKYNLCMAPNGEFFRRDKISFMSSIVERMFSERKKAKKEMLELEQHLEKETDPAKQAELESRISALNIRQLGIKVTMNSIYGSMGNEWFRYFDIRLARAITLGGQTTIKWVEKAINEYMNSACDTTKVDYVTYVDTDSTYVTLDKLVDKIASGRSFKNKEAEIDLMDKLCKDILTPMINRSCDDLLDYTNGIKQMMVMKREVLADTGIWVAKKRYALNVWDSEGVRYATPKIKVKGMEIVRSSTPQLCRSALKECVNIMLRSDIRALREHVETFKKTFMASDVSAVAFPRGVNGIKKYQTSPGQYDKGTPIQVKGAIVYNRMLKEKGVDKKYRSIGDGEKIKFVYLKEPNPIREESIAFRGSLPTEFGLDKYIDYDVQYRKNFLDPVTNLCDVIGWELEEKATLESFFM